MAQISKVRGGKKPLWCYFGTIYGYSYIRESIGIRIEIKYTRFYFDIPEEVIGGVICLK
jgi:hypothetical protein